MGANTKSLVLDNYISYLSQVSKDKSKKQIAPVINTTNKKKKTNRIIHLRMSDILFYDDNLDDFDDDLDDDNESWKQ